LTKLTVVILKPITYDHLQDIILLYYLLIVLVIQLPTWQKSSISQKVETKITINGQILKYVIFFAFIIILIIFKRIDSWVQTSINLKRSMKIAIKLYILFLLNFYYLQIIKNEMCQFRKRHINEL